MTLFYPNLNDTGALLTAIRVAFGTAMVASILIAYAAIKRRDIDRHRAWMIRAYALALGVSTQIFTLGFGQAIVGDTELSTALLIAAGWVINLAIAEWAIALLTSSVNASCTSSASTPRTGCVCIHESAHSRRAR